MAFMKGEELKQLRSAMKARLAKKNYEPRKQIVRRKGSCCAGGWLAVIASRSSCGYWYRLLFLDGDVPVRRGSMWVKRRGFKLMGKNV